MCERERKYHNLLTLHLICSECSSSWWSGRGTDSFLLKALSFSKDTSMPFSHRSQFYASTRTVRIRAENTPRHTHNTHTQTHRLQTFPFTGKLPCVLLAAIAMASQAVKCRIHNYRLTRTNITRLKSDHITYKWPT